MDSQSLMCLDWILASTEYIEFVYMMLDFKVTSDMSSFFRVRKTGTVRITNTMLGLPMNMVVKKTTTSKLDRDTTESLIVQ